MAIERDNRGLQIIFAIFLGLMVTAFIGIGVNTVYPPPDEPFIRQMRDLERRSEAVSNSKAAAEFTPAERARIQQLRDSVNQTQDALRVAVQPWTRTTSIILIAFATLSMAISLIRADQLPVLSNGLLLGGVFTMIYGVGLILTAGSSAMRLVVMAAALLITVGLGYARFVRGRANAAAHAGVPSSSELADVDQRLRALEKRMDDAAAALSRGTG